MSTIKSSDDHLVLNAEGTAKTTQFQDNGTERARIDTNGNLLVGTTNPGLASSSSVTGINLNPNSETALVRDNGAPLYLNRLNTDGAIVQFRKGGTKVGQIDVSASGASIYLGGTAAANALDDYEEGTWTPVYSGAGEGLSGVTGITPNSCRYVKIGSLVILTGQLIGTGTSSTPTGDAHIAMGGLPFTPLNTTDSWDNAGTGMTRGALNGSNLANYTATVDSGSTNFYLNYTTHTGSSADFTASYTSFHITYRT